MFSRSHKGGKQVWFVDLFLSKRFDLCGRWVNTWAEVYQVHVYSGYAWMWSHCPLISSLVKVFFIWKMLMILNPVCSECSIIKGSEKMCISWSFIFQFLLRKKFCINNFTLDQVLQVYYERSLDVARVLNFAINLDLIWEKDSTLDRGFIFCSFLKVGDFNLLLTINWYNKK